MRRKRKKKNMIVSFFNKLKEEKAINFKIFIVIILTFLVTIVDMIIILSRGNALESNVARICTLISSTSAAIACVTKGIKDRKNIKELSIMQSFILVLAITSHVLCNIYEFTGVLYVPYGYIIFFTVVSFVLSIVMVCKNEKEIIDLSDKSDEEETRKMVEEAESSNDPDINTKTKGDIEKNGKQ